MADKLQRVRIVHDSTPSDPREQFDNLCVIERPNGAYDCEDQMRELLRQTPAWQTRAKVLAAVGAAEVDDYGDPTDPVSAMCEAELEHQLAEAERCHQLWVREFHSSGHVLYLAHVTPEMANKIGVRLEHVGCAMDSEIATFRMWCDGDVYGYVIEEFEKSCACADCDTGEWVEVDSCWGFYGSDPFENGMSEHVPDELHEQLREAEVEYSY